MNIKTGEALRPMAALAALCVGNCFSTAHARDGVVTATHFSPSDEVGFQIQISGSTGPMTLPGSQVEYHIPGNGTPFPSMAQVMSIAASNDALYFTAYDLHTETAHLYQGSLSGGPLTTLATDVGKASVIVAGNAPVLIENDDTNNALRFFTPGGNGSMLLLGSIQDTHSTYGSPVTGYDATRNEVLILKETSNLPFGTNHVIQGVSLDNFSTRTSDAFSINTHFSTPAIVTDNRTDKLYIRSNNFFQPGLAIELDTLSATDAPPPTFTETSPHGPLDTHASDVVSVEYGPGASAMVNFSLQKVGGSLPTLLRKNPAELTLGVSVANHAIPDGTTVSNFKVDAFYPNGIAPGITVTETTNTPGSLTDREIGTVTLKIDPQQTEQGIYRVAPFDMQLSATHTSGSDSQTRKVLANGASSSGGFPWSFAVEAINGNFVGNGNMDLGTAGFDTHGTGRLLTPTENGNKYLHMRLDDTSDPWHVLEADIQLGLPDDASVFSFDYRLTEFFTDEAYLRDFSVQIVDSETNQVIELLTIPEILVSEDFNTAMVEIDSADLEGFVAPRLQFRFKEVADNTTYLDLDNIRWTLVPEPAGLLASLGLMGGLLIRPGHRRR